jgi:hypothetical protein
LAITPALAHRLDEYLQGTILSVDSHRLHAQITLTPGVAVLPVVLAAIDPHGGEVISETKQRAYALRVLGDIDFTIDGHILRPQLLSVQFPGTEEMKDGRGEIQIEFNADLPRGGRSRKLVFKNHHQSRIAAYQVNCLVPRDPAIRVIAQNRNRSQSVYELEYEQATGGAAPTFSTWFSSTPKWMIAVALFLFARFVLEWLRARRNSAPSMATGTKGKQAVPQS